MPRGASARVAPAGLSKTIDRNLRVYSTAALAAGVGMLALATPAQGEVVVTKKTISIPFNPQNGPGPVGIDFNHDGIRDFSAAIYYSAYPFINWSLSVFPPGRGSGGGMFVASRNNYALALARGAKIGPSAHFSTGRNLIEFVNGSDPSTFATYTRTLRGNWGGNPKNRFLGVKFLIQGKAHYGWIRLTVITDPRGLGATITGYAYETVPNKAITAGAGTTAAAESEGEESRGKARRNFAGHAGGRRGWVGDLAAGIESCREIRL